MLRFSGVRHGVAAAGDVCRPAEQVAPAAVVPDPCVRTAAYVSVPGLPAAVRRAQGRQEQPREGTELQRVPPRT